MNGKDTINIKLKPKDESCEISDGNATLFEKHNFGTSALNGRTERNVTFHPRGAHDQTKFDNAFPGAYFNILKSAIKMVTMFFRSK